MEICERHARIPVSPLHDARIYRIFDQLKIVIAALNNLGQEAFGNYNLVITAQKTNPLHILLNSIFAFSKMVSQFAIIVSDDISDALQSFKNIPLLRVLQSLKPRDLFQRNSHTQ